MVSFPTNASDQVVKGIVTEWVELLAEGKYQQALDILYQDDTGTSEVKESWTLTRLVRHVNNYGLEEPLLPSTKEQYKEAVMLLYANLEGINEWQPDEHEIFWVTPITEKIRDAFEASLNVDRLNSYGLNPDCYSGMVHVNLPLNETISDLTAQFFIRKIGADNLALELFDLHVM